ncbi:G-type lectin S-receptor-like serine/threonine-protein kinase SD3-1 [Rhodamnia argentea]|uniref:Receptor-like serine/threonine-protein kinase n=1 Tax=Rhodamnia argentea TaxID=178133 RepID=A0A8B8NDG9_9MYRT|nr:G-type lectin S-receptor-like serine/threonine-protein kinase SD3-1 [Rhodamnia argentea]
MVKQVEFRYLWIYLSIGFLLSSTVVSEVPLGSKLSVEDNNFWVSSNGDFALGFYNSSPQSFQYSVGIHFNSNSIPANEQKVVWVAGAEIMVGNKSYFQLTQDGELILFDSLESTIAWSSKTSQLGVVSAVLHDDGNFILLNDKGDRVWQSFDSPSNTLLPGQKLPVFKTLRAQKVNSISSYYSLYMNESGQLQLRWETDVKYWTFGSVSNSNVSAVLTSNGALLLLNRNSKPIDSLFGEDHSETVKFRFLRLDTDGNLRMYSWREASASWISVWQAVDNQCNVFATCGDYGICFFNSSGLPDCMCPFKSDSATSPKCLLPYQQGCKSGSIMLSYEHTFLHGMYPVNDSVVLSSVQQCKDLCLKDPLCTAVTFTDDGSPECLFKTSRYITGYTDPSLSSISFVKKCSDPIAVDPNHPRTSPAPIPVDQSFRFCIPCLAGAASGTFITVLAIQLAVGFYIYKRRNWIWKRPALAYKDLYSKSLVAFSFMEIEELTGSFKHQIGPKMYKGMLPNRQPVAIKDVEATVAERKFRAAVSRVGSIHHKYLIKLEGYCCESIHRYLVYEYAKNGSLEKYIEDPELSKRLTWKKRLEVCLSVAKALSYLHSECREFISHGNLKCENIVLDENLDAKVSEFGLSIIHGEALSPDISAERDVEDFGKLVVALVSGCRDHRSVSEWAYNEMMVGQVEKVVDKRTKSEVSLEELNRVMRIAFWCLQGDERLRPSMGEVVKVLEGSLTVDPPPPPFCRERPLQEEESSRSGSES